MTVTNYLFPDTRCAMVAGLLACLLLPIFHSFAQTDFPSRAEEMMNRGEFQPARQILEQHLQRFPNDASAHRLLGRLLYWLHDFERSRFHYTRALGLEAENTSLRLEYGRMLVETRNWSLARDILQPLRTNADHAAEAEYLLGLIEYWDGDWTSAVEHFEATRRVSPQHADARRHLRDIRITAAPSISFSSEVQSDTQPLDRLVLTGRAVWNRTPLQAFTVHAERQNVRISTSTSNISTVMIGYSQYHASLRVDTEAGAGLLQRSFTSKSTGVWRAAVGLRPSASLKLRFRGERNGYDWTTASVETPVHTTSFGAFVDWNSPGGWTGQAAYESVRFFDKNTMQRSYLWLLAPVLRDGETHLSIGYGFSQSDTKENRFTLKQQNDLRSGVYSPYYTPEEQSIHDILGFFTTKLSSSLSVRINFSYALYAVEQAPYFFYGRSVEGPPPVFRSFSQRTFRPWKANVALAGSFSSYVIWSLEGAYWATAYYDSRQLTLNISYRFIPSE
jgi:tetratricopeptide (TPR) repeat protein